MWEMACLNQQQCHVCNVLPAAVALNFKAKVFLKPVHHSSPVIHTQLKLQYAERLALLLFLHARGSADL
jgi:hypothetical protein